MIRSTEKTLSEVLQILKQRGYTEDFNLLEVKDSYKKDSDPINIKDLVIDKIYRFSEQNDVGDEAILYAMHNSKDGAKGVFVNGYGLYIDEEATAIIDQIPYREVDTEDWTENKH
ncbi:hypothetical protein NU10_04890 [Flavobacterium dauae]|uniref:hypothetical protein n=1 Tax=Flavobacterium dauae TaxID=1563479 RepID=UPI00101B3DA7|nr:hypothetical protein [Flavobacterium dauae]WLD24725.1 hypothetical protein NU10_04890 [Flavobacterium dauae]